MKISKEVNLCITSYAEVLKEKKFDKDQMVRILEDFYQMIKKIESNKTLNLKELLN